MRLTCSSCGKVIETLPLQCAYSINFDSDTNQWECFMEECGYFSINEFVCENCCINRNIFKINKMFERLSLKSEEFKEELSFFKKKVIQINLSNSDFSFWVEFGNGIYRSGNGIKDNPSIIVSCPQKTMNQILKGNLIPISEFLIGDLNIQGDIQYAVVFFDLVRLGLEINKEMGGV